MSILDRLQLLARSEWRSRVPGSREAAESSAAIRDAEREISRLWDQIEALKVTLTDENVKLERLIREASAAARRGDDATARDRIARRYEVEGRIASIEGQIVELRRIRDDLTRLVGTLQARRAEEGSASGNPPSAGGGRVDAAGGSLPVAAAPVVAPPSAGPRMEFVVPGSVIPPPASMERPSSLVESGLSGPGLERVERSLSRFDEMESRIAGTEAQVAADALLTPVLPSASHAQRVDASFRALEVQESLTRLKGEGSVSTPGRDDSDDEILARMRRRMNRG